MEIDDDVEQHFSDGSDNEFIDILCDDKRMNEETEEEAGLTPFVFSNQPPSPSSLPVGTQQHSESGPTPTESISYQQTTPPPFSPSSQHLPSSSSPSLPSTSDSQPPPPTPSTSLPSSTGTWSETLTQVEHLHKWISCHSLRVLVLPHQSKHLDLRSSISS